MKTIEFVMILDLVCTIFKPVIDPFRKELENLKFSFHADPRSVLGDKFTNFSNDVQ